ncbi:Ferric reductase like transmembrane component-containing protein 8 [Elsinoe fawcettii]|nr:Ferric reductase like transmembrane component-containing protein 8 [Elsinoe fawcettii]
MDDMEMTGGVPWLMGPIQLHAYREYECSLNTTAECQYYQGYWRFWYEADHRFALPTVALFTAAVLVFAIARLFSSVAPKSIQRSNVTRQTIALSRVLTYTTYRIPSLDWHSAPLGVLLLGGVGLVFFLCMTFVPQPYYWPDTSTLNYWGGSPPLATRSGWLSLGCMPFVFMTAGKSNFITAVTGVSHEKLQVFHRWISYTFLATALVHTFPFIVYNIKTQQMQMQWDTNLCYWTGVVAIIAQAYLTFASISPLRHMSYEWFKFSHFVAALVFMLFLFFHCSYTLSSWDYFIVSGVFFVLSWLHRQLRIYFEHGINNIARVSLASNGYVCVKVQTTASWNIGQHFFVRFLHLGAHAWTIHPFTACSLPTIVDGKAELVFYIRPRGGFTARLARHAESHPDHTVKVLLDGPYGGVNMRQLQQSQRQLVIAGGSGAGWVLPFLHTLLRDNDGTLDAADKMGSPPKARIVLATRDVPTREWFAQEIREILAAHGLDELPSTIQVQLYYTGPKDDAELDESKSQFLQVLDSPKQTSGELKLKPSSSVRSTQGIEYMGGRPDLPSIVESEVASTSEGTQLGVFLCGPLSMQSNVSNAVAKAQKGVLRGMLKDVYLHVEHFSWA